MKLYLAALVLIAALIFPAAAQATYSSATNPVLTPTVGTKEHLTWNTPNPGGGETHALICRRQYPDDTSCVFQTSVSIASVCDGASPRNCAWDDTSPVVGSYYQYAVLNTNEFWSQFAPASAVVYGDYGDVQPYDPDYVGNAKIPGGTSNSSKDSSDTGGDDDPDEYFAEILADDGTHSNDDLHFKTANDVPSINVGSGTTWTTTGISGSLSANSFDGPSSILTTCERGPNPPNYTECSTPGQDNAVDDYPIEVLNPSTTQELRVWQADPTTTATTITGSGGGIFYYNHDNTTHSGTESLAQPVDGGGAGDGSSYLSGLITQNDVDNVLLYGAPIRHEIRIAVGRNMLIDGATTPPAGDGDAWQIPARKEELSSSGLSGTSYTVNIGQIYEIASSVNCSARTVNGSSTSNPAKVLQAICKAGQDYGFRVSDGTTSNQVVVYAENNVSADWNGDGSNNNSSSSRLNNACSGNSNWSHVIRYNRSCTSNNSTDGLPHTEADWEAKVAPGAYNSW